MSLPISHAAKVMLWLMLFCLCLGATKARAERVVGFFAEWGRGYNGFAVDDINVDLLSHLVYEGVTLHPDGRIKYWTPEFTHANLEDLAEVTIPKILSVGGWNEHTPIAKIVRNDGTRHRMVNEIAAWLEQQDFSGVLIDWRYPGVYRDPQVTPDPNDSEHLVRLLQELDIAIGEKEIWLTTPVYLPALRLIPFEHLDEMVDVYSVLSVDMAGPWEGKTNFISPLHKPSQSTQPEAASISSAVEYLLQQDTTADKILLNISALSRSWAGVPSENSGLFQTSTGAGISSFPNLKGHGELIRKTVLTLQFQPGYQYFWDEQSGSAWLYSDEGQFISFEDKRSLFKKQDYITQHQLGGVGIQYLYADHDLLPLIHTYQPPNLGFSNGIHKKLWLVSSMVLLVSFIAWLHYRHRLVRRRTGTKALQTEAVNAALVTGADRMGSIAVSECEQASEVQKAENPVSAVQVNHGLNPTNDITREDDALVDAKSTSKEAANLSSLGKSIVTELESKQLYLNNELSLSELAHHFGLSNQQLSEILNRDLEVGFYDLLNQQRLRHAEALLRDTSDKITDVMLASGFNNKVTFYNVFKKQHGCTPSAWRKKER